MCLARLLLMVLIEILCLTWCGFIISCMGICLVRLLLMILIRILCLTWCGRPWQVCWIADLKFLGLRFWLLLLLLVLLYERLSQFLRVVRINSKSCIFFIDFKRKKKKKLYKWTMMQLGLLGDVRKILMIYCGCNKCWKVWFLPLVTLGTQWIP